MQLCRCFLESILAEMFNFDIPKNSRVWVTFESLKATNVSYSNDQLRRAHLVPWSGKAREVAIAKKDNSQSITWQWGPCTSLIIPHSLESGRGIRYISKQYSYLLHLKSTENRFTHWLKYNVIGICCLPFCDRTKISDTVMHSYYPLSMQTFNLIKIISSFVTLLNSDSILIRLNVCMCNFTIDAADYTRDNIEWYKISIILL